MFINRAILKYSSIKFDRNNPEHLQKLFKHFQSKYGKAKLKAERKTMAMVTRGGAVTGGTVGALSGGLINATSAVPLSYEEGGKDHKDLWKLRLKKGAIGALGGGLVGGFFGANLMREMASSGELRHDLKMGKIFKQKGYVRMHANSPVRLNKFFDSVGLSGNEKTKKAVDAAYKRTAMTHHPDIGGSEDAFRELKFDYDNLKQTQWFKKLATPQNLPIVSKLKGRKEYVRWSPGLKEKLRELLHIDNEAKPFYAVSAGATGLLGGLAGLMSTTQARNILDAAYKDGKISEAELKRGIKNQSYLRNALIGAGSGAGVALALTRAGIKKAPSTGLMAALGAGSVAGGLGGNFYSSHKPTTGEKKATLHEVEKYYKYLGLKNKTLNPYSY